MGLADWLRDHSARSAPAKLTRRDFLARFTGRNHSKGETTAGYALTRRFAVDAFEFHDGPAIVATLSPGVELQLRPDPPHLKDPRVRVYFGHHLLGYAPTGDDADIRALLAGGERFRCRVLGSPSGGEAPGGSVEVGVFRLTSRLSSGR